MAKIKISKTISKRINEMVDFYVEHHTTFQNLANILLSNLLEREDLCEIIHSHKVRAKNPEHLRGKLERKARDAIIDKKSFDITTANLFVKINDLAGVRLLHLHTNQMEELHPIIMNVLKENNYILVDKPVAYTWDYEYSQFFKSIVIEPDPRDSMYTSVHYIVEPNRKTKMRCELQVRTLMEEVWGEVSHKINYPHKTKSLACEEQLKVLARVTSSGTRLVDSIFTSDVEYKSLKDEMLRLRSKRNP